VEEVLIEIALIAAKKKITETDPATLSLSFHNRMDTTACPDVIKTMASQLTWLFGAGRILAARNRCQMATIQCAARTSRASVRAFVIV
jgi:hypothetical protein